MQWPAFNEQTADRRTELSICLLNFQVIQIDIHSITMSMKMKIVWWEDRLLLDTPDDDQTIYLSMIDQKEVWFPQITIGNNMVSEKRNSEEFGFYIICE